jgi:hypothetical protein
MAFHQGECGWRERRADRDPRGVLYNGVTLGHTVGSAGYTSQGTIVPGHRVAAEKYHTKRDNKRIECLRK